MIEVKSLSLERQGQRVLDKIDLTLPRGGITALVGPNGAGKSTLLALMARLLPLETGTVTIDGLDIAATPGRLLAKKIAILRQESGPPPRVSIREMVGFGRFPHSGGRMTAEDRAAVEEALSRFELQDLAARSLDRLSGGQRQRVMVAMTYCQGTDYILLDEPLNNLDMYHARRLMIELRRLADQTGRTIIIVLHDINHASASADRIVAMKDGRILADGPPGEIMRTKILQAIYGFAVPVISAGGLQLALHYAPARDGQPDGQPDSQPEEAPPT
ncbi:ABC transporter ATP-binding protein [Rhizobium sp. SSA_523]|uniref:iron ABC transporter ATP-binding protein n=1 Tax=Rhizobium sp. SSA_523 TaxID=2952477 RepID=UPI002091D13A|nr:ATP-binding cassette domain-containing protein [Rhizobium sp. SSA_523]MCO5733127.1 ATP-binding cassette domain-containing protein [Rhizobium sp. SSA_523]WKC24001.1 ATP-binding cassette domain-containing protein [Rhizobium sp. SSA_523]